MTDATDGDTCDDQPGRLVPVIDRNRCEAKADCVAVCPYGVFEVQRLRPEDKATLTFRGKIKSWVHGGKQAYVVNPQACHACKLCVRACPEDAIRLRRPDAN